MATAEALALAGIAELAARRVDRLSGDQAQRLRFALAAAGRIRRLEVAPASLEDAFLSLTADAPADRAADVPTDTRTEPREESAR
jgi:hypothetical protein